MESIGHYIVSMLFTKGLTSLTLWTGRRPLMEKSQHWIFHKVLFETKLPLVFDCLEEVTRRKELESTRRWRKPFFECPKQVQSNDYGLFVWKFLECFAGETLCTNIDPVIFFLFLFLFFYDKCFVYLVFDISSCIFCFFRGKVIS